MPRGRRQQRQKRNGNAASNSAPHPFSLRGALANRYLTKIKVGLQNAANAKGLTIPTENRDDIQEFDFMGQNSTRFNNRPIAASTKDSYETHFRQLWKFCAIIGDYDSMLLLLKHPPKHCPAMSVDTVEQFFRFKRYNKGQNLSNAAGIPVFDIYGQQVTCDGAWNSPYIDSYKAALADLHATHGHAAEDYQEPCEDCLAMPEATRHRGCEYHLGRPVRHRRGNPTRSVTFLNTVVEQMNLAKEANYEEKGCSQFLPSDLRKLCTFYCGMNTLLGLQKWCAIILPTCLSLRYDEYHEIRYEHFMPDKFAIQMDDSRIDSLALTVKGKSDDRWVKYRLHSDHDHPDLCPVRPLLIYMYLMDFKGGFLFPSPQELRNPPPDGVYITTIDYQATIDELQEVCLQILPPRADFRVGCHIYRKTFYLVGVFGDANAADLQHSARHMSAKQAEKYRKSCASQYNTFKNHPTPENEVSRWKQCRLDTDGAENEHIILLQGGAKFVPMAQIAFYFIHVVLKIPQGLPASTDIITLLGRARSYHITETPREQVKSALAKVPEENANEIRGAYAALYRELQEAREQAMQREITVLRGEGVATMPVLPQLAPAVVPRVATTTAAPLAGAGTAVQHPHPNEAAKHAKIDLDLRHELKNMATALEKVQAMVSLEDERASGSLTGNAKSWASKFLKPVVNCLKHHHNGDVGAFVAAFPNFSHTTFPKRHCCGEGTTCTPIAAAR